MAEGDHESGGKEGERVPERAVSVEIKTEVEETSQGGPLSLLAPHPNNIMNTQRCDRCDYKCDGENGLVAHLPLCPARSKVFECDICQMKFSNSANMRRHKMRHTGVKPYECRVCTKRFFRKDHLQEHMTTHARLNPWKCPICSRGFQRQIAMRAHFQNEHLHQGDAPVKSCPLCHFTAISMKSLRVHFYNRHGIDLDQPGAGRNGQVGDVKMEEDEGGAERLDDRSLSPGSLTTTPPLHFLAPAVEISLPPSPASPSNFYQEEQECRNGETGERNGGEGGGRVEEGPGERRSPSPSPPTSSTSSGASPHPQAHAQSQACQYCGILFPDSTLYFLHKGCHSELSPWRCNICGDQTANVYEFNSHLLSKNHQ